MNFSLKRSANAPPTRKTLGEEDIQIEQPEKVRQVEPVKSHDRKICLPSNTGWILAAADKQEKHSINLETTTGYNTHLSKESLEDLLYQQDLQEHPDPPTAEEYEELSVEDFGAALLRGLEKNTESEQKYKDSAIPQVKRSSHLGVGAKLDKKASSRLKLTVPLTKRRKRSTPESLTK